MEVGSVSSSLPAEILSLRVQYFRSKASTTAITKPAAPYPSQTGTGFAGLVAFTRPPVSDTGVPGVAADVVTPASSWLFGSFSCFLMLSSMSLAPNMVADSKRNVTLMLTVEACSWRRPAAWFVVVWRCMEMMTTLLVVVFSALATSCLKLLSKVLRSALPCTSTACGTLTTMLLCTCAIVGVAVVGAAAVGAAAVGVAVVGATVVGMRVGEAVGELVGASVSPTFVGVRVGVAVGRLGRGVGAFVGDEEGTEDGTGAG